MKRVFFDMDGTMARFYEDPNCLEVWETPGFFLNLNPYESVIEAVKMLRERDDVSVYILSASGNEKIKEEKRAWLSEQFCGFAPFDCYFPDCDANKAEFIKSLIGEINEDDYLVDDYSAQLKMWQKAGVTAVKMINEFNRRGINGHHFKGKTLNSSMPALHLYKAMCEVFDLPEKKQSPTLIMMVGLLGSGKSTAAKALQVIEPNLKIVSTDAIRKELFGSEAEQSDPEKVFNLAHMRVLNSLKHGDSVIFDATNLSLRNRKALLNQIPSELNVLVRFWLMSTPFDECLRRNSCRERIVPEDVLYRMASRFKMPTKDEWHGTCVITSCAG